MKKLFNVRILGIFILCLSMAISSSAFAADKYVGKITRIKGEIRLKSDKRIQSGKWLRVKRAGVRIFNGDEIRSLAGETEITFNDGSVLKIKKNTHFKVEERLTKKSFFSFVSRNTINRNIKVFFGSLWAKVVPKKGKWTSFESKSAVAGIRGTTVSLSVDSDGNMQFKCDEGFVEIASPDGRVILKMNSGKEVSISTRPGGKSYIEVIKGEVEVKSGNTTVKMSKYDEVEIGTKNGETSIYASKGSVDVEFYGHIAKLDAGDAITYDSTAGLTVTGGSVSVTKPDGSTQEVKKGDSLTTGQETETASSKTDAGDSADEEYEEYEEDEEDEDALEVVDDPIPVETDLPPSQSNP